MRIVPSLRLWPSDAPAPVSPWQRAFRCILLANAVVVLLTLVIGRPLWELRGRPWGIERAVRSACSADTLCTVASVVQLAACGYVLGQTYRARRKQLAGEGAAVGPARVWLLMASGFYFLALDQATGLHKKVDHWTHQLLGVEETALTDRLDDAIVGAYAVAGLAVMARHRAELRLFGALWRWVAAGVALAAGSVVLDMATNRKDVLWWLLADPAVAQSVWEVLNTLEEDFKVLAEATLLGMFLACRDTTRAAALPAFDSGPVPPGSGCEAGPRSGWE